MGMILDTNDEVLGLEERRESFNVLDLKRKYPAKAREQFQVQRRLVSDGSGHACYEFSVVKDNGEHWLPCGNNLYKAEITADLMNAGAATRLPREHLSEHIFANADGEIEVSKAFLRKLVAFFEYPENRKLLEDR